MPNSHDNLNSSKLVPYGSNAELLADLMQSLDQKIAAKISRKAGTEEAIDQLRGLVITPNQISELLVSQVNEAIDDQEFDGSVQKFEATINRRLAITDPPLPLAILQKLFALKPIEMLCLSICLCKEISTKYETLFAFLHDDVTRKSASIELVLELAGCSFEDKLAARILFRPSAALFRYGLIEKIGQQQDSTSLLRSEIKLNERIVEFLLGNQCLASLLERECRLIPPRVCSEAHLNHWPQRLRSAIQRAKLKQPTSRNLIVHVAGLPSIECIHYFTEDIGLPLLFCSAKQLVTAQEDFISQLCREAALQPAILLIRDFELLSSSEDPGQLQRLLSEIQTYCRLTLLSGKSPWTADSVDSATTAFVSIKLPDFGTNERESVWQSCVGKSLKESESRFLASQFRFSPTEILRAANQATDRAILLSEDEETDSANFHQLKMACKEISKQSLEFGNLARQIASVGTWDNLVLPNESKSHLQEICQQAKQRQTVFDTWGFGKRLNYGKGISVMFAGLSGTGKTLAAEVMANELEMELYKIDLSQVVNKYIGQTEKNLARIFDAAANANVILFFDESDALFGKRSEVRDSHDRYSNLEVSYLLQKMEEFDGVSILATNLRKNMDDAFVRRLQAIVEFPFPDAEHRQKIWRTLLPAETPLADDVDLTVLADQVRLAGGNIKNITLSAACSAAANGGVLKMSHLVDSSQREYRKLGRELNVNNFATAEALS